MSPTSPAAIAGTIGTPATRPLEALDDDDITDLRRIVDKRSAGEAIGMVGWVVVSFVGMEVLRDSIAVHPTMTWAVATASFAAVHMLFRRRLRQRVGDTLSLDDASSRALLHAFHKLTAKERRRITAEPTVIGRLVVAKAIARRDRA